MVRNVILLVLVSLGLTSLGLATEFDTYFAIISKTENTPSNRSGGDNEYFIWKDGERLRVEFPPQPGLALHKVLYVDGRGAWVYNRYNRKGYELPSPTISASTFTVFERDLRDLYVGNEAEFIRAHSDWNGDSSFPSSIVLKNEEIYFESVWSEEWDSDVLSRIWIPWGDSTRYGLEVVYEEFSPIEESDRALLNFPDDVNWLDPSSSPTQRDILAPITIERYLDANVKIDIDDYNFDGHQDFRRYVLQNGRCNHYEYRIFDPASDRFVRNDDMTNLCRPNFVPKEKVIYDHHKGGCSGMAFTNTKYVWRDGTIRKVSRIRQNCDDVDLDKIVAQVDYFAADGKIIEETVTKRMDRGKNEWVPENYFTFMHNRD